MRSLLIVFTFFIFEINLVAQDINYFFYDIPWTLGTDTICKVIKTKPKKFKLIYPRNGEDQGYNCMAQPVKIHYLKNKPDSVCFLGFNSGFCDNTKSSDSSSIWVTGEVPAFSVELYYSSDKKRIEEYQTILSLLKKKYDYLGEDIKNSYPGMDLHKFKVNKNKDNPQIHVRNYFDDEDKVGVIRIILYQIPY